MLTGTGQFVHFDQTFSKVGWTLGANWQFTDRSGLFARYTPAFRLPNLGTYSTAGPSTTNSTIARPITQTMDLGELGYKYANEWTNLYATAFWTKYDNVGYTNNVFNLNTSEPPYQETRYTDTRTYGLELEGGFYPVQWFDLTFNATLEQPQYQASELMISAALSGFRLGEVPTTMRDRGAHATGTKKGGNFGYGVRFARAAIHTWRRDRKAARTRLRPEKIQCS